MYLSYSYNILCKVTGQFYFGSRGANVRLKRAAKDDLWICYFTSSKEIQNLLTLYGPESFEYNVLLESKNYDECYWYEQDIIKQNISNPLCINRYYINKDTKAKKFSTFGYPTRKGKPGTPKTKTDKEKMSIIMAGKSPSNKGKKTGQQTVEHRKRISDSIKAHWIKRRDKQ